MKPRREMGSEGDSDASRPLADRQIAVLDPEWVEIPAGSFQMGGGSRSNALPRHRVSLAGFRLARTPVRREQYQLFLDAVGHAAPPSWHEPAFAHPSAPAVGATWHDAVAYCRWLSSVPGSPARGARLPSEAEWEWAADLGRQVPYPWGEERPEELPDYDRRWLEGPEPVDAYASRHPLGLVGLCQNVHEWCSDWYSADYYAESPEHDPRGPSSGRRRASRGGAWRHAVKVCPIVHRSSIPPDKSYTDYGFRLAAPAAAEGGSQSEAGINAGRS